MKIVNLERSWFTAQYKLTIITSMSVWVFAISNTEHKFNPKTGHTCANPSIWMVGASDVDNWFLLLVKCRCEQT